MIPGQALHRLARWICSAKTLERVVEPAIADLQKECADGAPDRSAVLRLRVLGRGYIAIMKVIFMCALDLSAVERQDRSALIRTLAWTAAGAVSALVVLIVLALAQIAYVGTSVLTHIGYVMPQALPIAIPIGVALGIALGLNGISASLRTKKVVLLAALVASAVSFGTIGWAVPQANESYRQALYNVQGGRDVPAKGVHEMTFSELRQFSRVVRGSGDSAATRRVDWHYHVHLAISFASLALAFFAVVLNGRRVRAWKVTVMALCAVYFLLLAVGDALTLNGLPPIAGAWLANVSFAAAAYLVWSQSSNIQRLPVSPQ